MFDNLIEAGDNSDITNERKKATFSIHKMASFIYEGEDKLARRRQILDYVNSNSAFDEAKPVEFLSREGRIERNAKMAVAMTDYADAIDGSDIFGEGMYYQMLIMGRDFHGMSLHYAMFLTVIQNQTNEEQLDKWLPLTLMRAIIGTYAQTELGHGTNLKKLETTATYSPATGQFILHTPTITGAKYWPGGLGKSATHCAVMAQLYTKGTCHGPHLFIVQLRDQQTHQPLNGITIGDIGPKLGVNGTDNGFLLFDNFAIPRQNMLMKHCQVTEDGDYVKPKHKKLGFGAMVFTRAIIIRDVALSNLAPAVTIATRYSAIRRQGEIVEDKGEVQILDYQTQQYRIFPAIARTFAFIFAASEIRDMYMEYTDNSSSQGNVSLLAELHALSSGLKAVVSWEVAQCCEQLKLACGGHGYSLSSSLPQIYGMAIAACTYEGENIVMLLHVSKILMKTVMEIKEGTAELASISEYLMKPDRCCPYTNYQNTSPQAIIEIFEHLARTQIYSAYNQFSTFLQRMTFDEAINKTGVELCKATRNHVRLYLVSNFYKKVNTCPDANCREVLDNLWRLYAYDVLSHCSGSLLKERYMDDGMVSNIQEGIYYNLSLIRDNAVGIVDSLDMSDRELHSVLGRRDGHVYENILEWAKNSPLNQKQVLPTFAKYFGPMMAEGRSKL